MRACGFDLPYVSRTVRRVGAGILLNVRVGVVVDADALVPAHTRNVRDEGRLAGGGRTLKQDGGASELDGAHKVSQTALDRRRYHVASRRSFRRAWVGNFERTLLQPKRLELNRLTPPSPSS